MMMNSFRDGLAKNWVEWLLYFSIAHFIFVEFGQNLFDSGTFIRKWFYFSGMSWNRFFFSILLFKAFKNDATKFFMGITAADLINNMVFFGAYNYLEVMVIIIGTVILTLK